MKLSKNLRLVVMSAFLAFALVAIEGCATQYSNPCAANPCASKNPCNPCASKNPCKAY